MRFLVNVKIKLTCKLKYFLDFTSSLLSVKISKYATFKLELFSHRFFSAAKFVLDLFSDSNFGFVTNQSKYDVKIGSFIQICHVLFLTVFAF